MLIIHGTYHFGKKKLETREDVCNSCERLRIIELWRSFNVFHIFWIPLIPLGSHSRWKCAVCHNDPHARYKTSKPMKIAGLFALAIFLVSLCSVEPKPDEVAFMWGARIVLSLAFLGLLYSVLKRTPVPSEYSAIAAQCKEQLGHVFRCARSSDLEKLRQLRLPETVIDFYRNYEPVQTIENEQGVRLHPIAEIAEQNAGFMPGCYTAQHGYVVFATNFEGDAYAFDLHHLDARGAPSVALISHEMISEESTPEEIAKLAKPVAANLKEFLSQFLSGKIDEQCLSYEDIDE